jgi:hypothetical protein
MEKIVALFESKKYKLPIINNASKNIHVLLFDAKDGLITQYIEDVSKIENIGDEVKSVLNRLSNGIKSVLISQHRGSTAYKEINALSDIINSIKFHIDIISYDPNTDFYRLRFVDNKEGHVEAKKREELFHIPFQSRRIVSNQRYSIPGFPCLYIGNSVYTCWQELRQPSLDNIQLTRFRFRGTETEDATFQEALKVYDLTFDYYNNPHSNLDETQIFSKLILFPLIAACSIRLSENQSLKYVPEYIIPQIVLDVLFTGYSKSIREEIGGSQGYLDVNGLCYSSTRTSDVCEGLFHNIVISSEDGSDLDKGYSSKLMKQFLMTEVLAAWQLDYRIDEMEEYKNDNVEKIKIGGSIKSYEETKFGVLEYLLSDENGVVASKIDF